MCPRCEALQERVEELEWELGMARDQEKLARLAATPGLTPQRAEVLMILYAARGRLVTKDAISERITRPNGEAAQVVHVLIHKIRRALGDAAIETAKGGGCCYRITGAGAKAVEAAFA